MYAVLQQASIADAEGVHIEMDHGRRKPSNKLDREKRLRRQWEGGTAPQLNRLCF